MTIISTIDNTPSPPAAAVDLYREVHKGLRLALFELAEHSGRLDAADAAAITSFTQLFADVDMMLETHHGHEDGKILCSLVETHVPDTANAIAEAHGECDRRLEALRSHVRALASKTGDCAAIYDEIVSFVAFYIDHMQVEEHVVMPALQANVPVDQLTSITMAIRTSVPPPEMCIFLRYMLPAMTPDERTATLGGMKAGAPPEIFELFWGVAETHLSPHELSVVADRIAI